MKTAPLSVAASLLATSANAFLLPPNVTPADIQIIDNVAAVPPASTQSQKVNLNCPGCAVTITGPRGTRVIPDKPNHLELEFSVAHEETGDRLLVNGFELYPSPDLLKHILTAKQVPDWKPHFWGKHHGPHHGEGKDAEGHRGPWRGQHGPFGKGPKGSSPEGWPHFLKIEDAPLGFGMHTKAHPSTDGDNLTMLELNLQIIEVGNNFVKGIPEVRVNLIKDNEGRLMIGKIEADQTTAEEAEAAECQTAMCRWAKAFFGSTGRPCHGKGKEGIAATQGNDEQPWEPREHSWGMLFKNIASHILLPVAIGIIAGVSVSLIGMVVGTLIVSLWRTFVRPARRHHSHRRHHSGHSHKTARKEAIVEEEKSGLMEDQEAPPSYEAEADKKSATEV